MEKQLTYEFDFTEYGPVHDRDGDVPDCGDNLREVLIDLYSENKKITLKTRILVVQTRIRFDRDDSPSRYQALIIRRVKTLLQYYEIWFREEFNLEEAKANSETEGEALRVNLQKQRDRADAWGPFIYCARVNNAMNRAKEISKEEKGDPDRVMERLKQENLAGVLNPFL